EVGFRVPCRLGYLTNDRSLRHPSGYLGIHPFGDVRAHVRGSNDRRVARTQPMEFDPSVCGGVLATLVRPAQELYELPCVILVECRGSHAVEARPAFHIATL